METFIVLLRGVNVGGHNKLKMADLKAALTDAGFEDVQTYIQSGNIVLRSEKNLGQISDLVVGVLEKSFGLSVPVLTISETKLAEIVNAVPFEGDPSRVMLYFCFEQIPADFDDAPLQALKLPGDAVLVRQGVIYFHAPQGIGRSKLAAKLDRLVPVELTARNLRTATKLIELAGTPH